MTSGLITVGPDSALKEAARRMIEAGVSGLPVTDADGTLLGIITEADFVHSEAHRKDERRGRLLRYLFGDEGVPDEEKVVGDVMTSSVAIISPDADHVEAARVMEAEGVKRLPVVEQGKLVGLVSRTDILRTFVRPDQDIIDEIQDHIMREILWIDTQGVEVGSVDGNVTLKGRLEARSDAQLLVALTRRVDGVASVTDRLTWSFDNLGQDPVSPPVGYPPRNW